MAIAFRQGSQLVQPGTGTSPHTSPEPSGAASGDLLIAITLAQGVTTLTRPTNWVNLFNGATTGTVLRYDVSYIVRGASAPSYAWTTNASSTYYENKILCYSGVSNSTPVHTSSQTTSTGTTATSPNPAAVTTTISPTQAVILGFNWAGSTAQPTAPSGYTNRITWIAGQDCTQADKALATATTEDPAAWGTFDASNVCWAATVALADAAATGGGGGTTPKNFTLLGVG